MCDRRMKYEVIIGLLFIYLIYSFLGWVLEVGTVAAKEGKFVNRGILNGPMCLIYGIGALIIILTTEDATSILGIFLGSVIYGTFLEFVTGKLIEKFNKTRWWDYSHKRFNLDGYICLEYSLLWGLLGVLLVKVVNPILLTSFNSINLFVRSVIVFTGLIITSLDLLTSFITLKKIKTDKIGLVSDRLGNFITISIVERLEHAYPTFKRKHKEKKKSDVFAEGISFYKLFWIFLIGAFVGDLCEIIYCRFSMHRFMSRSSLVFGQLSIVWGAAMALAALCLHRYKDRKSSLIFTIGAIMGGAFEYVCSVFTEFFFGTIFWDYSKIPFNLNGRINLLFCFVWGLSAVLFIKYLYPYLSNLIESIPKKIGTIVTNILVVLFVIDLIITGCVMERYHARAKGIEAQNIVEKWCDKWAPDDYMKKRWSNMKNVIEK